MNEIKPDGANIDDRPVILQEKDYTEDEVIIASGDIKEPFQNKEPKPLSATVYSQEYTSSCVPHGILTQLEYEGILSGPVSQLIAYRKRANFPNAGSGAVDIYEAIKEGQVENSKYPVKKGMREVEANALPLIKGEITIKDFKYFRFTDLTKVPASVALGKAIAIFIYASNDEYSREYVEATDKSVTLQNAYVRHCVCIVPNGDFYKDGKRWLTVHDSAKFGGFHRRYISYDFLLSRCYYASQVIAVGDFVIPVIENNYLPTIYCSFGERGEAVLRLQRFLIDEKLLDPQYGTGYYGSITARAVLWWQLLHHEKFSYPIPKLLEWGGKYWGEGSVSIIK